MVEVDYRFVGLLIRVIRSVNKRSTIRLNDRPAYWDHDKLAAASQLKCAPFLTETVFYNLIKYALMKEGLLKSEFPTEEAIKQTLKKLYMQHFIEIYGMPRSGILDLKIGMREKEERIAKDVERTIAVFLELVLSIPVVVGQVHDRRVQLQLDAEEKARSLKAFEESLQKAKARLEEPKQKLLEGAEKRRKDAEIEAKMKEYERQQVEEKLKAEREKQKKKQRALLEKEAKELPKKEREVFLNSRKGVFCEECGNMNQLIKLSRGKIARLCMAHDRGIIAKYNPELLRPEKAKRKSEFEFETNNEKSQ